MVSAVNAALSVQNIDTASKIQEAQLSFFKKTMDTNANTLVQLVQSAGIQQPSGPQPLATSGAVGTKLNMYV